MVIVNSELMLLLPPQEGVRDLPAQRGPYLVIDSLENLELRTVPYTVTAVLLGSVYGYGPYITGRILRFEMLDTVRDGRNTAVYDFTDV